MCQVPRVLSITESEAMLLIDACIFDIVDERLIHVSLDFVKYAGFMLWLGVSEECIVQESRSLLSAKPKAPALATLIFTFVLLTPDGWVYTKMSGV